MAGPTMRATWNGALLKPTAFGSSGRVTISGTNDCRVRLSTAWAMPVSATITKIGVRRRRR